MAAHSSLITWKIKVLQTGTFPLRVVSSTGQAQSKTISIRRPEGTPPPRLTFDLSGSYEPGQEFMVGARLESSDMAGVLDRAGPVVARSPDRATVTSTPTLILPPGLSQVGEPYLKAQAAGDGKGTVGVAVWKVKVLQLGTFPVRVEWNDVAKTKTLSITRPETPMGGYVTMALAPPFAPGKAFTVIATITKPFPGQTLTLQLPPGLHLLAGQEVRSLESGVLPLDSELRTPDARFPITWQVYVDQPGTYPLRLISSGGQTLRKTIIIE